MKIAKLLLRVVGVRSPPVSRPGMSLMSTLGNLSCRIPVKFRIFSPNSDCNAPSTPILNFFLISFLIRLLFSDNELICLLRPGFRFSFLFHFLLLITLNDDYLWRFTWWSIVNWHSIYFFTRFFKKMSSKEVNTIFEKFGDFRHFFVVVSLPIRQNQNNEESKESRISFYSSSPSRWPPYLKKETLHWLSRWLRCLSNISDLNWRLDYIHVIALPKE